MTGCGQQVTTKRVATCYLLPAIPSHMAESGKVYMVVTVYIRYLSLYYTFTWVFSTYTVM